MVWYCTSHHTRDDEKRIAPLWMTATLYKSHPIFNTLVAYNTHFITMSNASTLFSVAGKNVLVTGGSRGIGFMIAQGFAAAGANVVLTSRSEQACQEAADQLQNYNCQYIASNVSNRHGCEELASQVGKLFDNKLHCLINNAGTSWYVNVLSSVKNIQFTLTFFVLNPTRGEALDRKSSPKSNWGWDKVLDLNVKGMFYLTNACLPMLRATATKDDPARIVNIGSVVGLVPQNAPTHAYDVSKAAVHQLTRKFAADFASQHVTVNALAPGFVPSRMSAGLATWGGDPEQLAQTVPLQRLGNADDMAGACIYFCSRAGAWVTGTVLPVDGGSVGALQLPLSSL